jgi:hypothetical protein
MRARLVALCAGRRPRPPRRSEDRLSAVFQAIEANRLDETMQRVDALIRDYPNFARAPCARRPALARARPLETFGNVAKTCRGKDRWPAEEALARPRAQRQRPGGDRLPRYVPQLHADQKHALVVDSRRSRLYVFGNDRGTPGWSPTFT